MRDNVTAKILFILCAAALVLPWFTYSGTMRGYAWIALAMHMLLFMTVSLSAAKGEKTRGGT